jgi:hypothetical protein
MRVPDCGRSGWTIRGDESVPSNRVAAMSGRFSDATRSGPAVILAG